ncbi:MAG: OmpA family protein [Bacteroidia bacterium]|nr:OmpA family protein [Bacteroidia bacterium]
MSLIQIKKVFILFLMISMVASPVFSQDDAPKKKSKTHKADALYENAEYFKAAEMYKKCWAKSKKQEVIAKSAFMAGECYRKMNNASEMENWYTKSVEDGYKDPVALMRVAQAKKLTGKYDEAITALNKYKEKNPDDATIAEWMSGLEAAQKWKDNPTRYKVENLSQLNTDSYDFSVVASSAHPNTVWFTSSRQEATGTKNDKWIGQKEFDLFKASIDNNGKWSTPVPVIEPLNSEASDGVACYDPTGSIMYFTRCERIKNKNGYCKIYSATASGEGWGDPISMPFNSDDYTSGHPALSIDGNTMYFASDMPGGLGGKDIWMSKKNKSTGEWGAPQNMGSKFNTSGDEMFPTMRKNGSLFYSSNGKTGMGGLDLFEAKSVGGAFDEPINLESPINSEGDDYSIVYATDSTGYLSSSRAGGLGSDDIYAFKIPPLVFTMSGLVYDTDTKDPIPGATVELFGSDGTALSVLTGEDGRYKYDLKPNVKYKVSASYTGYLTKFLEVSTIGLERSEDFIGNFDFPLKSYAKPIELPEIYYDLDKATLRPESKTSLDGLITILDENPNITIKLLSHTDSRATDAYNQNLSDRRAKSVVDYLISKKVPSDRLSWEGRGEQDLRITDEEIDKLGSEAEKEEAHQKNRRTEFEVLSTTYVPKK